MSPFYTPWKGQKTRGFHWFSVVFRGHSRISMAWNGLMRPSGHLWEANNDCSKKHFVSFPHAHHCKISDFLHALKQHPPSLEKRLKEAHINSPFCSRCALQSDKNIFFKKKTFSFKWWQQSQYFIWRDQSKGSSTGPWFSDDFRENIS